MSSTASKTTRLSLHRLALTAAIASSLALAACGGSSTSGGSNATTSAPKKAAPSTTPVTLNASQQQTLGGAMGFAVARCTIGNVPGGGSQDGQISSDLNSFVALYKQVGGQAAAGGTDTTTMSAEAQKMTDDLSCDPSLAQILVSGTGTSSTGGAATTTTTAASNPQAIAVCTKILTDIPALGTGATAIGQYGKDLARLIPVVSGSQQATVFKSVGDIEKFLGSIMSTGSAPNAEIQAMAGDARQIGVICGGYTRNP